MLASITPLGERGRQSSWTVTVTAFLIGAGATGAAVGALAGAAGQLALGAHQIGARTRLVLLALALLAALALDFVPQRVPGPRRQVNERWLDEFRGWVYGLGFGAQLGLGVTTVVASAATYAALAAAFLSGDPGRGALVLGCFGAIRGLTPLATATVRRPDQLVSLHRRVEQLRTPVARLTPAALGALFALALAGWAVA